MSKQSGTSGQAKKEVAASVYRYTMKGVVCARVPVHYEQTCRVCACAPVHYEQTVRVCAPLPVAVERQQHGVNHEVGPPRYIIILTVCSKSGMAVRDFDGFARGSDSGGFGRIPSSPAGDFFAALYSLYGHFDPTETGSGFGRIR